MRDSRPERPVQTRPLPGGGRGYVSKIPPEALPPVRTRDLAAAWDAARERAVRGEGAWGEARLFHFPRISAEATDMALADPDACCWAEAIDLTLGLDTIPGLSCCLRMLALVHLLASEPWARGWISFRRDGAALDPALLRAAACQPLTPHGLFDPASLRRALAALPGADPHPKFLGAPA